MTVKILVYAYVKATPHNRNCGALRPIFRHTHRALSKLKKSLNPSGFTHRALRPAPFCPCLTNNILSVPLFPIVRCCHNYLIHYSRNAVAVNSSVGSSGPTSIRRAKIRLSISGMYPIFLPLSVKTMTAFLSN